MSQHILKDRPWWKMATLQPGLWLWWMTSAYRHQDHESSRNSEYPVTYHRPAENANMSRAWMLTENVVTYWALTSNLSTLCLRTEVAAADMTAICKTANGHTAHRHDLKSTQQWAVLAPTNTPQLTRRWTDMPTDWPDSQPRCQLTDGTIRQAWQWTDTTASRRNNNWPVATRLDDNLTRWMVAKRTDITANTSGCRWGFDPAWPCDSDNIMVIYSSSIACIRLYRRWSCIVQHILSGNFTLHVRGTRWHIIHTVSLHILQPTKKITWNPANHSWLHVTNGTDRQPVNRINYQAAWVGLHTQFTDTQQVSILHYFFSQI